MLTVGRQIGIWQRYFAFIIFNTHDVTKHSTSPEHCQRTKIRYFLSFYFVFRQSKGVFPDRKDFFEIITVTFK